MSLMTVVGLIGAGFLLNMTLVVLYNIFSAYKEYKTLYKDAVPGKIDESRLCKGPHSWITTGVLKKDGEVETKVCRICGLVSGTERMATPEAIDKIEEANKAKEIETRLWKEFLDSEDNQIRDFLHKELASGLDFNKVTKVHAAGMSIQNRFTIYLMSKQEEIEKELHRSN